MNNLENVDIDYEDIEPLYGDKSVNKLFPLSPSQTMSNGIKSSKQIGQIIPEGKAINTKPKELTYEPPKFQDSKPMHLPSATANPLSQGTAEYMNKLLQTTTNGVKDFGKGVVQGLSSIGVGLGKRYGNKIRQAVGKPPLSQEEMNNLYSNVLGKPEENSATKTGNIIGEVIPFLIMPTVEVASFPLITNLLLTSLYQSFIDSATRSVIDNGVSKKLISDVIKGVALALLNTLLAHGLLKGVDQAKLLKELEKRLQKLVDELAEILPNTIRQADGTVVLKKSGPSSRNLSNNISREISQYWKEKQLEIIKTNPKVNGIKSINDIKSFDEFDSAMNFIDSKDFKYTDYKRAQQTGVVRAYTNDETFSKGCLISPSATEAYKFSSEGDIYFLYIPVEDVAWTGPLKGQYAPIKHIKDNMFEKPLTYTGKYVKYNGEVVPELNFHEVEYKQLYSEFYKIIYENKAKNKIIKDIEKELYDYIYEASVIDFEPIFVKVRRK